MLTLQRYTDLICLGAPNIDDCHSGLSNPKSDNLQGLYLAQANDNGGTGHEARNDGVSQEVGDPTQAEDSHQGIHHTSNERDLQQEAALTVHSKVAE